MQEPSLEKAVDVECSAESSVRMNVLQAMQRDRKEIMKSYGPSGEQDYLMSFFPDPGQRCFYCD